MIENKPGHKKTKYIHAVRRLQNSIDLDIDLIREYVRGDNFGKVMFMVNSIERKFRMLQEIRKSQGKELCFAEMCVEYGIKP